VARDFLSFARKVFTANLCRQLWQRRRVLQSHQPKSTSDWDVPRTLQFAKRANFAPRKQFCQAIFMILLCNRTVQVLEATSLAQEQQQVVLSG
jgi:hypothetical protein